MKSRPSLVTAGIVQRTNLSRHKQFGVQTTYPACRTPTLPNLYCDTVSTSQNHPKPSFASLSEKSLTRRSLRFFFIASRAIRSGSTTQVTLRFAQQYLNPGEADGLAPVAGSRWTVLAETADQHDGAFLSDDPFGSFWGVQKEDGLCSKTQRGRIDVIRMIRMEVFQNSSRSFSFASHQTSHSRRRTSRHLADSADVRWGARLCPLPQARAGKLEDAHGRAMVVQLVGPRRFFLLIGSTIHINSQ